MTMPALTAAPAPKAAGLPANWQQIQETAREYEGAFLSQMLQHMFSGVPTDSFGGGGQAEENWRGLLVDEYGKMMAKSGGVGISNVIAAEMLKIQENGI